MKKWYELSEQERIKQIYSKFTIKDFFKWWSEENNQFMEIRIKDYKVAKDVGNKLGLSYSTSGVYINNLIDLKKVIALIRNNQTLWFGINPRKKNWNSKGWMTFGCGNKGGSSDENISHISFIFLDIDRKNKIGEATLEDLEKCDKLSELILERFSKEQWNKGYCKLCSGNGVQLIIKLDYAIKIPNIIFNKENKMFEYNEEFEQTKDVIRKGIGKQILSFCKKYEEKLGVGVDKSGFNINRVGALPFTKNFKFDSYTWRGIIDIKNGKNIGLTDYIMLHYSNNKEFKKTNVFSNKKVYFENKIIKNKIREHPLVKFILENNLPRGDRNNYIIFPLKCLIRDSGLEPTDKEVRKIYKEIEQKYGQFNPNVPEKKYEFSPDLVNAYCINNLITPVFELRNTRNLKRNNEILNCLNEKFDKILNLSQEEYGLEINTDIKTDLNNFRKHLLLSLETFINEDKIFNNVSGLSKGNKITQGEKKGEKVNDIKLKISSFLKSCVEKYSRKKTEWYYDNIMKKYLGYE